MFFGFDIFLHISGFLRHILTFFSAYYPLFRISDNDNHYTTETLERSEWNRTSSSTFQSQGFFPWKDMSLALSVIYPEIYLYRNIQNLFKLSPPPLLCLWFCVVYSTGFTLSISIASFHPFYFTFTKNFPPLNSRSVSSEERIILFVKIDVASSHLFNSLI